MTRRSTVGEIWSDHVPSESAQPIHWLWHGFIATGNVTLLTSQWKSGKTTLLSILLNMRVAGGELGGLAVKPGRTVLICEESLDLWAPRIDKHHFGDTVCFLSRPFPSIPTEEQWLELIDRVLAIRREHGVDLVVIDPLAPFLRSENHARAMLETLLALRAWQCAGLAVMLLHHPGRGERLPSQAARGSGALLGHVDVSLEMRQPGGDPLTRRRRLFAYSRHGITPRLLTLELDESGTIYTLVPETADDLFEANWEPIRLVLAEAPQQLTRQDILAEWPPGFDPPNASTVWRWLDKSVARGLVQCAGSGRKNDPLRYWLAEREAVWQQDPFYRLVEQQRQDLQLPFESLTQRQEKLHQAGESQGASERPNE
jgi:hypothetical protein